MSAISRVLVVEPDGRLRERLAAVVGAHGHQVEVAADFQEGLSIAAQRGWDVCLVSVTRASAKEACELLELLRKVPGLESVARVVVVPAGDSVTSARVLASRPDAVVTAPVELDELRAAIDRLVKQQRTRDALERQQRELVDAHDHDALTGTRSLPWILERVEEEFAAATAHREPLACCRVSIGPGSDVGLASRLLREALRETDLLGRMHGGEFFVVLPKTHLPGAMVVSERILRDLATISVGREAPSVGLAIYPSRHVRSSPELLRAVEEALERARTASGRRIHVAGERTTSGR